MVNFIMIVIIIFSIISIVIVIIIVISITLLVFFHFISKVKVLAIETGASHIDEISHRISNGNLSEMCLLFTILEVQELIKEYFSKISCHPFFGLLFIFR